MREKDIIGMYRCPGCGRICAGVSQTAAELYIAQCANYIATLEPAERESRTGDTPESLTARFNACGACGTPSSKFLPAKTSDVPQGTTLQPIIAPTLATNAPSKPATGEIEVPRIQDSALGTGDANADSDMKRSSTVDKLIRHVNENESYSFESLCKAISEAVSKAKPKD